MGFLYRRFPLYGRPWPFIVGVGLAAVGLPLGLGWQWSWSLQTGNVFLLLMIPKTIARTDPAHLGLLFVGIVGALFAGGLGIASRQSIENGPGEGWRRARFRFFPNTVLFGLLLLYFGASFLFDASVYGDEAPGGYAAFFYLDYAGLFERPVATGVGLVVFSLGLACTTTLAFERGLGWPSAPLSVSEPTPAPEVRIGMPPPRAPVAPARARPAPSASPRSWPAASPRRVLSTAVTAKSADAGAKRTEKPPFTWREP